jgi:hypothetical protein
LQVGEDPLTGNGLSIDAGAGDVNTTGIITASSFSGDINATSITSGILNNSRLPQNINVSGIVTAYSFAGFGTNIQGIDATNITSGTLSNSRLSQTVSITNLNNTGIATLGVTSVSSLYVSGVTTSVGGFVGNVTGIASFASNLTGTPNIVVDIVTASQVLSNISSTGISTVTDRLFVQNSIGVNTVSPTAEVHIVKNGVGGVQVTSTQESYVGIARTLTRGQQGGEIRFGNLSDAFSGSTSLDLVNYDLGNINQYIHLGAAGVGTGNFNWIYGQDQTARMTLTYGGRLGVGITNPDHELHIVGTSTITEDLYIGDDLFVNGDSNLVGDLTINGNFTTSSLTVTEGIAANFNNISGVSTFYDIEVTNNAKLAKVAIGTDASDYPIQIGDSLSDNVLVLSGANFIGIGTTVSTNEVQIYAYDASAIIRAVGVGTTRPRSAVDFADAGKGYFSDSKRFLITPRVSTAERNSLDISTVDASGAIVYNTQLGVHQAYNGSTWGDLLSSYTETSTLSDVTSRGNTTTNDISVGIITATNGFTSGVGTAVQITTIGNQLIFTIAGVGSTSLTLY